MTRDTLPEQFRALAWHHQRVVYTLMIRCAWETVRRFSRNDKHLQGTPGVISVLHTHSRRLDYHPHVHLVMPAAAVNATRKLWRTKTAKRSPGRGSSTYLFNHKALATMFRAKLLDALKQAGLNLPVSYPTSWVVDVKSVGTGTKALVYLGRYLYRGVIREKDIIACDNGNVTFRYRESKTKRIKYRTVSGPHFLWLLLRHVLPKGFRRARNFGFFHPNSKRLIALIRYLLKVDTRWPQNATETPRPRFTCRCCGAPMNIVATRLYPKVPPDRLSGAVIMSV